MRCYVPQFYNFCNEIEAPINLFIIEDITNYFAVSFTNIIFVIFLCYI